MEEGFRELPLGVGQFGFLHDKTSVSHSSPSAKSTSQRFLPGHAPKICLTLFTYQEIFFFFFCR